MGRISQVMELGQSLALFEVLDRSPERVWSFAEASSQIRDRLEERRLDDLGKRFLVLRILPVSDFQPVELFDQELTRWGYLRPGR